MTPRSSPSPSSCRDRAACTGRPLLGLVAALPGYRRRGLARALIAQAFGVLTERGKTEVTAEIDHTNAASIALFTGLGAHRTGGSIELIKRRVRR